MGGVNVTEDQDQFSCPICLDILQNPVTIPCGHSYCMTCITDCWDQENGDRPTYSCPQCRESFNPRPVLNKNVMMDTHVEKLPRTTQHSTTQETYAQPGHEACEFCVGRKRKATKSCLTCVASFCEAHLQSHLQYPALKKHTLVDTTTPLKSKICIIHGKILDIYCQRDKECICYMCTVTSHRGHPLVSAEIERNNQQQVQLVATRQTYQQRAQERAKEVKDLRGAMEDFKSCTQDAVQDTEKLFAEMINLLNQKCSQMKEKIEAHGKTERCKAEGLLMTLEQEVCELKKRDAELEQLACSDDHIHFIKNFQSLKMPTESVDLPHNISVNPQTKISSGNVIVKRSLSELRNHLHEHTMVELRTIVEDVKDIHIVLPLYPKTREEFLKYSSQITLDRNTAEESVALVDEKKMKGTYRSRYYTPNHLPAHPERFTCVPQVLCKPSVNGRCYWEAGWKGSGGSMAVAYKELDKHGMIADCEFGKDSHSWSLRLDSFGYTFRHNRRSTVVPGPSTCSPTAPLSCIIGVYLDHKAGALSFYHVSDSDTMTLLHKVQTKFTQPLYPGFCVEGQTSLKIR